MADDLVPIGQVAKWFQNAFLLLSVLYPATRCRRELSGACSAYELEYGKQHRSITVIDVQPYPRARSSRSSTAT